MNNCIQNFYFYNAFSQGFSIFVVGLEQRTPNRMNFQTKQKIVKIIMSILYFIFILTVFLTIIYFLNFFLNFLIIIFIVFSKYNFEMISFYC